MCGERDFIQCLEHVTHNERLGHETRRVVVVGPRRRPRRLREPHSQTECPQGGPLLGPEFQVLPLPHHKTVHDLPQRLFLPNPMPQAALVQHWHQQHLVFHRIPRRAQKTLNQIFK